VSARQYDLRPGKRRTHAALALCMAAALPLAWGIHQTRAALADEQRRLLVGERVRALEALRHARQSKDGVNGAIGRGRGEDAQHLLVSFLDRLEDAWRDDVALLRVEVDPSRKRASLQVRVESPQRLLDFLARLRTALGSTAQVVPDRHGAASDAGRWPIAANVTIQWS
jgi:hypothetical protein